MKTRMTRGIATMAVFGALAISVVGGTGSVGAMSPDITAQSATAPVVVTDTIQGTPHTHFTVFGDATGSTGETIHFTAVEVPVLGTGHHPLTKGGRFP